MSSPFEQLHLPLEQRPEPTLEEYVPGANREAKDAVAAMALGRGERFLYLFGGAGTGKTHLLHAACLAATRQGLRAHFVPLGLKGLQPAALDDLERLDLVAVDEVEAIAGDPAWEGALFDLFNRVREQGRALLTAANAAPEALGLGLPDLCSRLQWGPRYCLRPLDDTDCVELITGSSHRRGMTLGTEVARYIMNHHSRDPASLLDLIARIDRLSLREQRPPTIPLVRRLLREGQPATSEPSPRVDPGAR